MESHDAATRATAQYSTELAAALGRSNTAMAESNVDDGIIGVRLRPYYRLRCPSEIPKGAKTPERPDYSPIPSRESSPASARRTEEPDQNGGEAVINQSDSDYHAEEDDHDEAENESPYLAKIENMSATAPSRKMFPFKTGRIESTDEASLSPTSAPKTKKRRTMQQVQDSSDLDELDVGAERSTNDKQQTVKVQLSVAQVLDPSTDITQLKIYEASQLSSLKKCRSAVVDAFLADIKAAGCNEEVYMFVYRLENLERRSATASNDEEEEWLNVTPDMTTEYKKWIDKVSSGTSNEHMPRIQLLLVAEKAFGSEEPLLRRKDKQIFNSISTNVLSKKQQIATAESSKMTKKTRFIAKKPEVRPEKDDSSEEDIIAPDRQAKATAINSDASRAFRKIKELRAEKKQLTFENKHVVLENEALKKYAGTAANQRKIQDFEQQISLKTSQLQNSEATVARLSEKIKILKRNKVQLQKNWDEAEADVKMLTDAVDYLKEELLQSDIMFRQAAGHMAQAALDFEAGHDPRADLAPGEEPYWAFYLPEGGFAGAAESTGAGDAGEVDADAGEDEADEDEDDADA